MVCIESRHLAAPAHNVLCDALLCRYAEFLRERNEMANRDWLSMRDQVWKIEDFLAKWSKATEGKGSDDPIALILLKEIDGYR
jgi:dynein heavy chain 2, cytosolic